MYIFVLCLRVEEPKLTWAGDLLFDSTCFPTEDNIWYAPGPGMRLLASTAACCDGLNILGALNSLWPPRGPNCTPPPWDGRERKPYAFGPGTEPSQSKILTRFDAVILMLVGLLYCDKGCFPNPSGNVYDAGPGMPLSKGFGRGGFTYLTGDGLACFLIYFTLYVLGPGSSGRVPGAPAFWQNASMFQTMYLLVAKKNALNSSTNSNNRPAI